MLAVNFEIKSRSVIICIYYGWLFVSFFFIVDDSIRHYKRVIHMLIVFDRFVLLGEDILDQF